MNYVFSRISNKKMVNLICLPYGAYQIKAGNFSISFKTAPFDYVYNTYRAL
jgi:hypothetical protein